MPKEDKRWIWYCTYERSGGSWKDYEKCTAQSRKATTQKNAKASARRHEENTGHRCETRRLGPYEWRGRK